MTTIEEVVETWDKTHSEQKNRVYKIMPNHFHGRRGKDAVIKLSDAHPCEPWPERTCYVFSFNSDKNNNPKSIEVSFQRRTEEHPNTQAFYEFLKENFSEKFILSKGKINPNHLVLKKEFPLDSSAQDICEGMKELIKLTQKPICEFLAGKHESEGPCSIEKIINEEEATASSYYGDDEERRKRLAEKGDGTPKEETRRVKVYIRDADVKAEVLKNANGICAKCKKPAPFKREHGELKGHPYLEVHHKIWLLEGGKDNVENTVALCPNCHKEEHYGKRLWNS